MRIIVQERMYDFIAFIEGKDEFWDRGASRVEAIGNLIMTHPEKFNLTVAELRHRSQLVQIAPHESETK